MKHVTRAISVTAAIAIAAAVIVVPATTASAGAKGKWTKITVDSATVENFTSADLLRLGNGTLLVGWQEQNQALLKSAQTAVIGGAAKTVLARGTVASGWSSLNYSPRFAVVNGQIVAGYVGIHSVETDDPLSGPVQLSRSVDGVTWASDTLPVSGDNADGLYGFDLVSDGVTTYTGTVQTSTDIIKYHKGQAADPMIDDNLAAPSAGAGANVIDLSLAVDSATKEVWAAWYALGGSSSGIWTQRIYPTPSAPIRAPGTSGDSVLPGKAISITTSSLGGIWLGYAVGYPSATKVRTWSPLTNDVVTVASRQNDIVDVDLSAGPNGKLWAGWVDTIDGDEFVKAARSNVAKSRFGSIGSIPSSNAKGGGATYNVTGEGSINTLEVVVNATVPGDSGESAFYSSEIYPELTVATSKTSVSSAKGGTVVITVTDAGAAVKGATVAFNGKKYTTKASGKVVVTVKKGTKTGKKSITAKATGYAAAASKITVKK